MLHRFSTLMATSLVAFALAGCSEPADPSMGEDAVLIDVRTPEEYATAHLEGAQLLDLTGGEFAAALPQLDPTAEYLVYCQSGNRSAQAAQRMQDAGFTDVTDLGSMNEAAEATGIPVQ